MVLVVVVMVVVVVVVAVVIRNLQHKAGSPQVAASYLAQALPLPETTPVKTP